MRQELGPTGTADTATVIRSDLIEAARTRKATLKPWYAAVSQHANSRVDVGYMGPSTAEGYLVTSWDYTPPSFLQTSMRQQLGITWGGPGFIGIASATINAAVWPAVLSGGTSRQSLGYGPKYQQAVLSASGHKVTYTFPTPLTSFAILHIAGPTGGATAGYYKIDGGAAVNFSTLNAGGNVQQKLTVSSAVNSTLEIGWNSNVVALGGVIGYNGDENAGLQVHNLGFSGSYAKLWNDNKPTPAGWATGINALNLDLLIVEFGANERIASVGNRTSAQFQSDLTTLLSNLRAAGVTCPVILSMIWEVQSAAYTYVEPWANYILAARAVAASDSTVTVIDTSALMPGTLAASTYGLYNADNVHSESNGSANRLVAASVSTVLLTEVMPANARRTMPVVQLIASTTTALTGYVNNWYRIDPGTGTTAVTLQSSPGSPNDGAIVRIEHVGAVANAGTVTYVRGGTDTIEGLTSAFTLQPGEKVELTWRQTGTTWYTDRQGWSRDHGYQPEDYGWLEWTYDVGMPNTGTIPTSGQLQMVRLKIRKAMTITNVLLAVQTAGASLTAGRCFAGLYNSSLALLSSTADQATNWQSAGVKSMALSAAQTVTAGDYFVGFYWGGGTTGPTFLRSAAQITVNGLLATASSRYATSSTGLTTALPNPAATLVAGSASYWAAVS